MHTKSISVAAMAAGALLGGPARGQVLREEMIAPASTDPAIHQWTASHFVAVDPAAAHRDVLFVYIHGLGGTGSGAKDLVRTAARAGFLAVGLTYPCDWIPAEVCGSPSCAEAVRREILDGVDRSPAIVVDRTNCVENRLAKLLLRLKVLHPAEPWDAFVSGASPAWGSIVVWGHSQGGANAAVLGAHAVLGGLCMSGPPTDGGPGGPGSYWSDHVTPVERYFGFCHVQDGLQQKIQAWTAAGMDDFGSVRDVATTPFPYQQTHQLSTSLAPAVSGQYHNSVVADAFTPRNPDGSPVYAPVWRYMIEGSVAWAACAADLNGDGFVDFTDYLEFLNRYDAGDPTVDFNHDGFVDFADYLEFLNLFDAGC